MKRRLTTAAVVIFVASLSRRTPGIVNFDVYLSPDGRTLVFVDSQFLPGAAPFSAAS